MRSLPPLQLAVVIGLIAWLALKFSAEPPSHLPDWRDGELVVIVPPSEMRAEHAFETALAALFARQLESKLKIIELPPDQAYPALLASRAHLVAYSRPGSDYPLRFSKPYQTLDELALCHGSTPDDYEGLSRRKLAVAAGSPQEAALRELAREHEDLEWEARRDAYPVQLLAEVADGNLDCTVANEEQIAIARNLYPELDVALDLDSPSALGWAFREDADDELFAEAQRFLSRIRQDGTLRRLLDRYYGHNERLQAMDAATFITRTRTLLPHYRAWFEEAADLTGIDWKLLAALAYQESHWNPHATSPTGVRGMMMLTAETADRMGLPDRLDAHASILAGARYLQLLKEQLPLRISEADRLWLALAAYNQGMGHLEDARVLALQSGLNPDIWADVKRVMPLLSKPEHYRNTKRGKARGGEAVILVETVRLYHDMLKRLEAQGALSPLAGSADQEGFFSGLFR